MIDKQNTDTMKISACSIANFMNSSFNGSAEFRHIVKCRAGFPIVVTASAANNAGYNMNLNNLFTDYKPGVVLAIEVKSGNNWITVFARKGNNVAIIAEPIFKTLEFGTINNNHKSWKNIFEYAHKLWAGKSGTWASRAFADMEIAK